MGAKLSAELAARLEQADASELLEIILEMRPAARPAGAQQKQTRGEKVAALKEAFEREAGDVEGAISGVGGEVTGRAWLNRTLRARVPARGVEELSKHEAIAALDLPHTLRPDHG